MGPSSIPGRGTKILHTVGHGQKSKNLQIIDAGDGVQKREHCYTGVGIEIGTTAMENSLKFP